MRGRGPREVGGANSADLSTVQGPQRPIRLAESANWPIGGVLRGKGSWVPSLRPLRSAESANRPIGRVGGGYGEGVLA